MTLDDFLSSNLGRKITCSDNSTHVDEWLEWYKGKVESFHRYKIYTGKKHIEFLRYTLAMAKKACEDWANLLINEKTDITLSDKSSQNTLSKIFEDCRFWRKANDGIEKTFALGGGAFVVSVENMTVNQNGNTINNNTSKVRVSFINATKIKPITFENGDVTECAFVSNINNNTIIAVHIKNLDGTYSILNFTVRGEKRIDDFAIEDVIEYYVFNTKSTIPWFTFIRPNVANNIDIDSPMGVSVFANSIDILKSIDLIYDSYQNEFILGRKRIFINARAVTVTRDGKEVEVFDSNDVAFYVLPEADDDNGVFIQNDTQPLRVTEHEQALQNQLNLYSASCGFGTNRYKFNAGSVATATQIVSENSDLFRNLKKHEIIIEEALRTIVKAVIYASNTFTNNPKMKEDSEIDIKFDDSIIEDKQGEKSNDRLDVSMGVMSKAEYRSKWYNEDIKTAEKKIEEINAVTIDDSDDAEHTSLDGDGNDDEQGQSSQVDG